MYLKIVSQNEQDYGLGQLKINGPFTCPQREWLFECQQVEVRKHRIFGMDGYHNAIYPILTLNTGSKVINGDVVESDKLMEMLEVRIGPEREIIIAVDCTAYLMNDNGRTINKWVCDSQGYPVH